MANALEKIWQIQELYEGCVNKTLYNAKVLFTKNIYIQIIGDVIDYRTQNMLIN
jgi:hypothetical protein